LANRISPQRGPDCLFVEIVNARGQRAGAQHHREVLGLLFRKCASDLDVIPNLIANLGGFANAIIENDPQSLVQMRAGKVCESATAIVAEVEVHVGAAVFIAAGLSVANIASGDRRCARYYVVLRLIPTPGISR